MPFNRNGDQDCVCEMRGSERGEEAVLEKRERETEGERADGEGMGDNEEDDEEEEGKEVGGAEGDEDDRDEDDDGMGGVGELGMMVVIFDVDSECLSFDCSSERRGEDEVKRGEGECDEKTFWGVFVEDVSLLE